MHYDVRTYHITRTTFYFNYTATLNHHREYLLNNFAKEGLSEWHAIKTVCCIYIFHHSKTLKNRIRLLT